MTYSIVKIWISRKLGFLNKIWIGAILGVLAPLVTLIITYLHTFDSYTVQEFINFLIRFRVLTKLLALCVLPNLGLFFLFLYPDFMRAARGVLLATFLTAIIIIIIQINIGAF